MLRTWFSSLAKRWSQRAGVSALVALGLLAVGCERGGSAQQMPKRPPPNVTVATAIAEDVPVYLDEIGRTQSILVVDIVPQVGGQVVAAPVEEGAYVKKGDLLFQIDKRPYQARLDAAKASVAQALAGYNLASVEFTRIQKLAQTDVASQLEFDQKKSALEVAEAQIAAAKADVETAQLNLDFTTIVSPIDGRAGARLIDLGNVVKANGDPMVRIQSIDPIYAQFAITETDLATLRRFLADSGQALGEHHERGLKVLAEVPSNSRRLTTALTGFPTANQPASATTQPVDFAAAREGTLTFLDSSVQSGTGTVMLRATLPNKDRYFWPGQFVNVRLILTNKPGAVLVPAKAIQIGQQGSFIYVIKDGKDEQGHATTLAEIRSISVGQRQGEMTVVNEGLKAGEKVVVAGQLMVIPGAPVVVTNGHSDSHAPASQPVATAR